MGKVYTTPCGGGGASSDELTATLDQVLANYTAITSDSEDEAGIGTMNNWGSNTVTMTSNTATLSAGYYSSVSINAASRYSSGYSAAKVGNATSAQVLNGYTFTNAANVNAVGNMTNRGNVTITLNCGNAYTITSGYHGGGGTVTANSLSSQTVGNITAARVLNGYVGWANGTKYTGSMNNWGSNTVTMSANTASLSAGYYSSISINAANWVASCKNSASVSNTKTVSWNSGWSDGGSGVEAITYGNLTLSLTLSNGTITAKVSGTAYGGGARWCGTSWGDTHYASASVSGNSSGSI